MINQDNATKAVEAGLPTPPAKPGMTKPVAASTPATKVVRKAPVKAPVKTPVKIVAKPVVTSAVKAPAKTATQSLPKVKATAAKPIKEKKPKLVRDSFTIPKDEYAVLADLKQRAGKLSAQIKKSELLRAGIKALAAMSDAAFLAALKLVPTIKTGRPTKG